MSESRKIAVLIADVVKSREIDDREGLQENLKEELERVSKESENLVSTPSIMRGDEIEVAHENALGCFLQFERLEDILFPHRLKGGIGIGTFDTGIRENVSEMDGPAFHLARDALKESKKTGGRSIVYIRSGNTEWDELINTVLSLLSAVKEDWTRREREISLFYLRNQSKTHEEISEYFDVSRPMVSKTLNSAHIKSVKAARNFLFKNLSSIEGVGERM
ncbi:hypothetical protein AKJ40_04770 [candidate division MSBL1 archaeon SCGC-AAA259M10]|nr:hypothetical protein AKJ40_04770 [candidate division MSBL1 archaeon SCGC-AAA259M10]